MLGFHPYFDIRHNQDVLSPTRRPHFTHKEIPWCSLMSETEWIPALLNADRGRRSLENFLRHHWESDVEPPALWDTASNNCATACSGRSGGIAPPILNLGTRWRRMVKFTYLPLYPPFPLNWNLCGPQSSPKFRFLDLLI